MKKIIMLCFTFLLVSCFYSCEKQQAEYKIDKNYYSGSPHLVEKVQEKIESLGKSDKEQIIVDCGYTNYNFVKDVLVTKKYRGRLVTWQYEFYDDKTSYDETLKYYSLPEVKDLFNVITTDIECHLIVVEDLNQPVRAIEEQYKFYSQKKYIDAGYKIIK